MYNHILLASDGSHHALRATEEAIILAKMANAKVTVVYVVDHDQSKSDVLHNSDTHDIDLKRKQQLYRTEAMLQDADVQYAAVVLHGEPGPAIIEYANEQPVDLLIIGSRGLNKMQEMVLGSVSHKVAKRVKCPVLIVK
ncbi:universal stress protein [Bacillus atrophaeus]|uniref:universal stress protein n=1 Tax=Bacillus atrophaeus TaxID=1452 RepID=UPI001EFB239B|nr:universal stress protein [Bacillus atrophaeus]MCG8398130.1 universal stress protein [Bacillus atrophaeus]